MKDVDSIRTKDESVSKAVQENKTCIERIVDAVYAMALVQTEMQKEKKN